MNAATSMQMVSPSFALLIALILAGIYLFIGVWAFSYVKPESRDALTSNAFRVDFWWPFHGQSFDISGRRLCGPGKILFVAVVLALLIWAWSWIGWAMAG